MEQLCPTTSRSWLDWQNSQPVSTLLKGLRYVPRVIITEKLKSYGAAKREILPGVEHRQSRYLNKRCENSHRPTRQRAYRMQGFKAAGHAQRLLSAYGPIAHHFRPRRHLWSAAGYRQEIKTASRVGPKSRVRSGPPREQIGPERGAARLMRVSTSTTCQCPPGWGCD